MVGSLGCLVDVVVVNLVQLLGVLHLLQIVLHDVLG